MHDSLSPSHWVRRFAPLISQGGIVLDLACGRGRHARLLAAKGFRVEAVDRDAEALASLAGVAGITARIADLEGGPWPYASGYFDGVVVTNYLFRPLFDALIGALKPGGVLIYETFMIGNELVGRPANPEFLLRPGELLDLVQPALTVVAFEQGRIDSPRPAVVQRICAITGAAPALLPQAT
ncbi:SAM-dependent methyltransferase [Georgfuchsia toluolica]|uniref:SAM-dependent methyltransferase n=1 Tax=Georgfuchsia toluolica TaxID=424218 RepID=A0A916J5R6_9PROT|nr:class I SAM-dependent methyltransferase [Georgfuchsia toluolica]CAG4884446.1 SAM-dependent methyltransferase [Georgfuchsia toluolica]